MNLRRLLAWGLLFPQILGYLAAPGSRNVATARAQREAEKRMRDGRPQTSAKIWFGAIASLLVASGVAISPTTAAPISFHFDATISQVFGDPSTLNLPFSFAVGEPVTATYTFSDVQTLLNV